MNLNSLTRRLSAAPRRLVVVETDGLKLRAAIVRGRGDAVVIERMAESQSADIDAALSEALSRLGADRPKRAVLLTPEATGTLMQLPVDPRQPRPAAQMTELVRWELEPQIAVAAGARPIGEILVGRGHMSYEQVAEVLDEIKRQQASAVAARRRPARFGEIAQELGFAQKRHVEEALRIQQRFRAAVDDLVCGWSGCGENERAAAHGEQQFNWLASGMSRAVREAWVGTFAVHELELVAVYPQVGASAAALNGEARGRRAVVLELQTGAICVTHLNDGRVTAQQLHLTAGRRPTAELCRDLVGSERFDTLWIAGNHPLVGELAREMREGLGLAPQMLEVAGPQQATPATLASLAGAARHAMRLDSAQRAAAVPAKDPAPPLWKQPRAVATAAALTIGLGILACEAWITLSLRSTNNNLEETTTRLVAMEDAAAAAQARIDMIEGLKKQRDEAQAWLTHDRSMRQFLDEDLPRRTRFLPRLLDAIAVSTTEEVAVERIDEAADGTIVITAWALGERSAEEFAMTLNRALAAWRLSVVHRAVWDQNGRLGLPGYVVEVRIGPLRGAAPDEAWSVSEKPETPG